MGPTKMSSSVSNFSANVCCVVLVPRMSQLSVSMPNVPIKSSSPRTRLRTGLWDRYREGPRDRRHLMFSSCTYLVHTSEARASLFGTSC